MPTSSSHRESPIILALLADERTVVLKHALAEPELYIVGGAVRDAIGGVLAKELDFTVPLLPAEISHRLAAKGIVTIPTGLKHQTVTAVIGESGRNVEITTFHGPGMRPEGGVQAATTIEQDLYFRDFTINSLALAVASGTIVDPHGGMNDLQQRVLRSTDPTERFREDPLRIMRMVRFASTLGFTIERATFAAARELRTDFAKVSVERIRDELVRILLSERPDEGFQLLHELRILQDILPEVVTFFGFEQNKFHKADLFVHTFEVVKSVRPELIIRLAALFHDVAKPLTVSVGEDGERHFFLHEKIGAELVRDILHRLKFSNASIDAVARLVLTHMRPLEAGSGGLRRILRDTAEHYPLWRELKEADALACKVDEDDFRARLADFDSRMVEVMKGPQVSPLSSLAVDGNDLMSIGFAPSRALGDCLKALHEMVLDNPELNSKEALLPLAQQRLRTDSAGKVRA